MAKVVRKSIIIVNFLFVGASSVLTLVVSNALHTEQHKLHELNDIYQNKKARVVIGQEQGDIILKKMKKAVKKKRVQSDEENQKQSIEM